MASSLYFGHNTVYLHWRGDCMRLKNGDFYTSVLTNKLYRLNEDENSNWYFSLNDEDGYHETEKTSGRDMIRLVENSYKKKLNLFPIIRLF